MDTIGEPKFDYAKKHLTQMISVSPTALNFFRFLSSRSRSTPITDVPQLSSYMREKFGENFNHDEMDKILGILFHSNFCMMRSQAGRMKIHWFHWLFPIFNNDESKLLGIETKPVKALQDNRNAFGRVKKQIEKIRATMHLPENERQHKADIEFDVEIEKPIQRSDLSQYSIEELLKEIERRGLKLQLQVSKSRK